MLTARLLIDCADQASLDQVHGGVVDLQVTELDAGITGVLLRTHLRPLRVEALSTFAAADPPDGRLGPLVRVFLRRPTREVPDGEG